MRYRQTSVAIALGVSILSVPATAQVTVNTGLEFITGDYGKSSSTDEWRIPLGVSYRTGPWNFRLNAPISRVEGVANVVEQEAGSVATNSFVDSDDDGIIDDDDDDIDGGLGGGGGGGGSGSGSAASTSSLTSRTQTGLGDATASAFYTLLAPETSIVGLDIGGRIKLPIGSKNKCFLTNGEIDYTVQADVYQSFGRFEPFASVGWTKRGDPQRRDSSCSVVAGERVDLRDPLFFGFGSGFRINDASTVRIQYEYREKLRDRADPRSEAKVSYLYRIGESWRAGAFATTGFSDNSPDWSVGASISFRF